MFVLGVDVTIHAKKTLCVQKETSYPVRRMCKL